jgi:hypothetical protein
MKRFYERGILEKKWIQNYCKDNYHECIRFQMEEKGKPHPDNMLPNGEVRESLR